jgi:hypothetical protein
MPPPTAPAAPIAIIVSGTFIATPPPTPSKAPFMPSKNDAMAPYVIAARAIASIGRQNFLKNVPMFLNNLPSHEYPLGSMSASGLFIT